MKRLICQHAAPKLQDMNIDDLRKVLLVNRLASFSAAARTLGVDASSISRSVAAVEAELGARIFQRSTRRFSLTEEGADYLHRIEPLVDEFDNASAAVASGKSKARGTLRLTASVAFAHECIIPLLDGFHRAHPDLSVELVLTDEQLDLIKERIDLALRLAPAPSGDLISTRLLSTRYRVVVAPSYLAFRPAPKSPSDLSAIPVLRFSLPGFRDRWKFRDVDGDIVEVPVSGWLLISNALALRNAVRCGLGPALLADWLIAGDLADGRLVELFPDYDVTATAFQPGLWALYPSRTFLAAKVRAMIDFLRASLDPGKAAG